MIKNSKFPHGYILYPSGDMEAMPEPDSGTFSLAQLQAAVGGYIEQIFRVPPMDQQILDPLRVFLVDEDGLRNKLDINIAASSVTGHVGLVGPLVVIPRELMG